MFKADGATILFMAQITYTYFLLLLSFGQLVTCQQIKVSGKVQALEGQNEVQERDQSWAAKAHYQ